VGQFRSIEVLYALKLSDLKICVRVNNFWTAKILATFDKSSKSYFSYKLQCLKYTHSVFERHSVNIDGERIVAKLHQYRQIWNIYSKISAKILHINTALANDAEGPIIDSEVKMGRISRGIRGILNRVDWSSCGDHVPYQHISLRDLLTSKIQNRENVKSWIANIARYSKIIKISQIPLGNR